MSDFFHAAIDLDKLAAKLEGMGFVREGSNPAAGRADRAAPDDWPAEPADDEGADGDDPWGEDEPRQERRAPQRSAPRSGGSSRSSGNRSGGSSRGGNRSSGGRASGGSSRGGGSRGGGRSNSGDVPTEGTHTDGVGKEWTFGLDDAPTCDHGMVAAEVTKPGAQWRAWACPVGFGKNYKDKCDLWEYQD